MLLLCDRTDVVHTARKLATHCPTWCIFSHETKMSHILMICLWDFTSKWAPAFHRTVQIKSSMALDDHGGVCSVAHFLASNANLLLVELNFSQSSPQAEQETPERELTLEKWSLGWSWWDRLVPGTAAGCKSELVRCNWTCECPGFVMFCWAVGPSSDVPPTRCQ